MKYYIRNFRTKKDYLIFQVFQLLLALIIIVCAMTSSKHFKTPYVLWMEFVLLLTMAFDLFVIRYLSEGGFKLMAKGVIGKIDLVVFVIFAVTLIFLAIDNDEEEDSIL